MKYLKLFCLFLATVLLMSSNAFALTGSKEDIQILQDELSRVRESKKIAALNYTIASMSKERPAEKYVIVNVPAYEAYAVQNGRTVITSKVIIGKGTSTETETPQLTTYISGIVYNPTWSPPRSSEVGSIIPEWKKDPGYLRERGFDVVQKNTQQIVPASKVTPEIYEISNNYKIVQAAGPNNVLGRLMLFLVNNDGIYMHDTNRKDLFGPKKRNFSAGCIRVERVFEIAAWASNQTKEDIKSKISQGSTYTEDLQQHIPVYVVYWPANVVDGRVVYYEDLYSLL